MEKVFPENQTFAHENYSEHHLPLGDYDRCHFENCNFTNADLSGFGFVDCSFTSCNLSMIKLNKTLLNNVQFKDCKMLGLHFEQCSKFIFSVGFNNCILDLSSFFQMKMRKMKFIACSLKEVDFAEADLGSATFDNCDLLIAAFDRTNLEKADFRTAVNYSIDPETNKIKKAKFSLTGVPGLLQRWELEIE